MTNETQTQNSRRPIMGYILGIIIGLVLSFSAISHPFVWLLFEFTTYDFNARELYNFREILDVFMVFSWLIVSAVIYIGFRLRTTQTKLINGLWMGIVIPPLLFCFIYFAGLVLFIVGFYRASI